MNHKKFMDIERIKEEPETVKQIDNFGKIANSIAMGIARAKI